MTHGAYLRPPSATRARAPVEWLGRTRAPGALRRSLKYNHLYNHAAKQAVRTAAGPRVKLEL